jgi:hypothetical protein
VALRSACVGLCLAGIVTLPASALADETDNFTCRTRELGDSLGALDAIMNERIQAVLAAANRREACDDACLLRDLQRGIGGAYLHPLTGIPHSKFERWIAERDDVERCRLRFRDSIYGARPYNQPWLFPFTGRVILIADSIRLSDTMVGLDKINHFIREGLAHWKASRQPGRSIADIMKAELGPPRRQFRWNEYGLKGWSFTGVLAYADLAASYSGFRFWNDLLVVGRSDGFLVRDPVTLKFEQRRSFTFADYVNDAWDEGINCSVFHPTLATQVQAALRQRSMICPATPAASLWTLPDAALYLNPSLTVVTRRDSSLPDYDRRRP